MENTPDTLLKPSAEAAGAVFPRHLHGLDALRGLAALAVVLWHWQHFFCGGPDPEGFQPARQPFYGVFRLFYDHGWQAVDLFFCLSGFLFFWLYAEGIARRAVSLREFAVLRLSRLYPLHLATLLFVAVAQAAFLRWFGRYFVFQQNDGYHFALQTVLASNWGLEKGLSFNGPGWSVSVEVLLYAIFWVLCWLGWRRPWQLTAFVCAGCLMTRYGNEAVGRGLLGFFAGGLVFAVCRWMARRGWGRRVLPWLGGATVLLWVGALYLTHSPFLSTVYTDWHLDRFTHGQAHWNTLVTRACQFLPKLVLYPLTILTLALWEVRRGGFGKQLAFLGQISYSSYLLHFPLQMVFIAVVRWLAVPTAFFYTPASLFLFFVVLIPLSLASFWWFELPCQTWLRTRLLPERRTGKGPSMG